MNIEPKKVWVVGHKNPDTDSICAAISYAYLKNQLGERQYVPKRAGAVSEETRYVLDYFKVEDPELITDVGAQLKDISIRKTAGISSQISLKKAWETMKKLDVVTLPVTNRLGKLEGVIVTKDIATSYMDVYDNRVLSKARTQCKNIAETLDGNIIAGNEHAYFIRGKVVVGASDLGFLSEYIEADDMVILGPQKEVQIRALESNASCIIVGCGFEVDPEAYCGKSCGGAADGDRMAGVQFLSDGKRHFVYGCDGSGRNSRCQPFLPEKIIRYIKTTFHYIFHKKSL